MKKRIQASLVVAVAIGGSALVAGWLQPAATAQTATTVQENASATPQGAPLADVTPATLSGNELLGETAFAAKCAGCHGVNAAGIDGSGPPLIHQFYEPNHHGDAAFYSAVQNGTKSHHWPFGDMPPVEGLTKSDVANIIAYVRAVQRANGIL